MELPPDRATSHQIGDSPINCDKILILTQKCPIVLCLCKNVFINVLRCSGTLVTIKVFHLMYVYEPKNYNQFVKPFLEIQTCSKCHVTHVNVSFE